LAPPLVQRHLHDLRGCFCDAGAFEAAAAAGNPLLYSVGAFEPAKGDAICIMAPAGSCLAKS